MKIYMTGYNKTIQDVIKGEAKSLGIKTSDISFVDLLVRPDTNGIDVKFFVKAPKGVYDSKGQPVSTICVANTII